MLPTFHFAGEHVGELNEDIFFSFPAAQFQHIKSFLFPAQFLRAPGTDRQELMKSHNI